MAESKSGGGSSATQDKPSPATEAKQQKTDSALKNERGKTDDRFGGDEPLPYPEHEVKDSITYRDPRPLDWPQKADRSVFVSPVFQANFDPENDDEPKGDYVDNAGLLDQDELEIGGDLVEDAQVLAGSNQLTLILNGKAQVLHPAIAGSVYSALGQALQLNANS